MRLIDEDAYSAEMAKRQDACGKWMDSAIDELTLQRAEGAYTMLCEAKLTLDKMPTIDAVPIKFIDEVIEYLTKCRDYAIHEETKTSWDEQRQTLIMLLHEWAAWNECGRTGKYGERREG